MKFKKVGIALKPGIHKSEIVHKIINFLISKGMDVYVDPGTDVEIKLGEKRLVKDMDDVDFIISLGGDGTLMYVSRHLPKDIPILTVNFGGRGFLATLEPKEFFFAMESLLKDNYFVEYRTRLDVFLNNKPVNRVLNEVLVMSCPISKLFIDLYINNERLKVGRVDGIIVSTLTGSTAHAFSAGGPIITPDVDVIEIIPINPLDPSMRMIITSTNAIIKITINKGTKNAYLVPDGETAFELEVGDEILIRNSNSPIRLIKFKHINFLERVYSKLLKVK